MLPGFSRIARITRRPFPGISPIAGYPHYFPLSYLGDSFWDNVDVSFAPIIRVTDQYMQEVPFQIVDFDQDAKTGALWFKGPLDENVKSWYIHWDTETAGPYADIDEFGSRNVWTNFLDVVHANETPVEFVGDVYLNSATGALGNVLASKTNVASVLEQRANYFPDEFAQNEVTFEDLSDNAFDVFNSPRTFVFLLKVVVDQLTQAVLLSNWTAGSPGFQAFRLSFTYDPVTPNNNFIGFEFGQGGVSYFNRTNPGELSDLVSDTWYVVTIKYDLGAGGFAVDFDKISRHPIPGEEVGVWPVDLDTIPTKIGEYGFFHNVGLASVMLYNGALNKGQRDVFFDNWKDTANFWRVNLLTGPLECVNAEISTEVCIATKSGAEVCVQSQIGAEVCLKTKIVS